MDLELLLDFPTKDNLEDCKVRWMEHSPEWRQQQMQQQMQMLNGSQPDSGPEGGLLAPGSPPMEQPQSGEPQA